MIKTIWRLRSLAINALLIACLLAVGSAGVSADEGITRSVFAAGGGTSSSGNATMKSVVGQGAIGFSSDGSYQLYSGFWRSDLTQICAGSAVCFPDTHWAFEAHALNPTVDTVYCGDFGLCSTDDIDTSTIRINDSIVPISVVFLDEGEYPPAVGLTGRVLRLEVPTPDLIQSFGLLYDESVQQVYVSAGLVSGGHCAAVAQVLVFGHVSGDVSCDGLVDIADLVYMVSYLFTGGPAPPFSLAADLDGSCTIDIADLVYLIDYMFNGGAEPSQPCSAVDAL